MSHHENSPEQDIRITRKYLARIIAGARQRFHVPAVAVAVMNSEAIMLLEVQGVRIIDTQDKAELNDYFHIGSCSKSVLAVMAAKLIEQKKLTWRTKFFDVFPQLTANARSAYHNISLEDLFLCEAGIKSYTNAEETETFPEYGPAVKDKRLEFIKYLVGQPPASERKNERFQHLYSNASYTMAAAMLEKASGQPYEALVKKTLTDDLGFSVHIGWPNSISPDQPWGHLVTKSSIEAFPPDHGYKLPFLITPAGDLSMTPRDYATYTQMHLQGLRGGDNYISSGSYRHIHFGRAGFSLGVANGVLGGRRYSGFDGSAGTFFCRSIIVPESDFAFTLMTNAGSGSGAMKAVDQLTMRIIKKRFNWWWKFWL